MQDPNIPTGVYEQIINRLFNLKLSRMDAERFYIGKKQISKDDAVHILSKYLQRLIEVAFVGVPDDQEVGKYTDFVNSVIKTLGREFDIDDTELDLIDAQKSILTAVIDRTNCEYPDIEKHLQAIMPVTSLSRSALFFGGRGPADMESELNREILCSDVICWVVSFIKTSGLNLLWNSLKKFTSEGKNLRVITTTYTGATDYDAVARLSMLPNTEVKISYDGTQDRLHAKSYIFLRNSGFHTAYIGSSNLSRYALKDGKEWNFKATQFELPQVIEEVRNSFETYWCDETFETFIPGVSDERLKKALGTDWETPLLDFSALDLMRAKDYQQEILEKLDVERHRLLVKKQLQAGTINYLFVVDLFNEGVDIPEIDTILFLRPTESATVFLQQFGRGLRLHKGKDHLTVLDFVGHSRAEFSYKDRFEALIGRHSRNIKDEIEGGFTNAPFGCKIILEDKAKEEILANIEGYLRSLNKNRIIKEIAAYHKVCKNTFSLKGFLAYSHVPFHKLYGSQTWGELCQLAGVKKEVSAHSAQIRYAVRTKWLATDSFSYLTQLLRFAECGFRCDVAVFSEKERRCAVMLYYDLFDKAGFYPNLESMFSDLASDQLFVREFKEVISYLRVESSAPEKEDNSVYREWNPLRLHGVYTKAQIQAALGLSTIERKSSSREGVERLKNIKLEAMYVDIIKQREEGSLTAYRDYAQNREFFHWETQNRVREGSREAEAYRNGENNMLLFVRQQVEHPEYGCRMGFTYLGQVTMKSIEGSKPMQIVWHLNTPMSEATYAFASQYKAIG